MRLTHLFLLFSFFYQSSIFAQSQNVNLNFRIDSNAKYYGRVQVTIEQSGIIQSKSILENFIVEKGKSLNISFENVEPKPSPILGLKIFSDTTIYFSPSMLKEVLVKSNKYRAVQTLDAYEYKPYLDEEYAKKPLYQAMERLPFIVAGNSGISYKDNRKILFQINGRERPGINSWEEILKILPAREIYMVKMITELPENVKRKNYDVILDIHTLDFNLYGKMIQPIIVADSRKNLNPMFYSQALFKRWDFGLDASYNQDRYDDFLNTSVTKNGQPISKTKTQSQSNYNNISTKFVAGFRLDSTNNLSLSAEYKNAEYNSSFLNQMQSPANYLGNIENNSKNGKLGLGYIKYFDTKRALGLGVSYSYNSELQWNASPFLGLSFDSSKTYLKSPTQTKVAEFYYNNTKKTKLTFNIGAQAYHSKSTQDFSIFNRYGTHDVFIESYRAIDSMKINQSSINAYLNTIFRNSNKRSFQYYTNVELYNINILDSKTRSFLLPTFTVVEKEMFKKNRSLRNRFSFDYSKPSLSYLLPLQRNEFDFNQVNVGNPNLKPEKSLSLSSELSKAAKFQSSHKFETGYSYDRMRFITNYDSTKKLFISTAENSGKAVYFSYAFSFSGMIKKNLRFFTTTEFNWVKINNEILNQKNSGANIFFTTNGNYNLKKNLGSISFYTRLISNQFTEQGNKTGYFNYNLSYGKTFLKNKIVAVFIAENFLLKNRNYRSNYKNGEYDYVTENIRPYRLFKLRLSYRFSNMVRQNVEANKFNPSIRRTTSDKVE